MNHPLYQATVPVFVQLLGSLDAILTKAQAQATARKFDADALLQSRLFPDMFAFARQVQLTCDFAKSVPARLAAIEVPSHADTERTFDELHARIAKTLAFIRGIDPAAFAGSETHAIVLHPGKPNERRFADGTAYALHYGLPNFYFHVTTAYNLLRHNGIEIGKKDYLGQY
ncbi:MAG: DUF1993 domain-containing protein [Rhodanobacter sp.]|jgi:hypothetical protein|nr:DUF1993 domain-containing protein [Rhodanobacter sp.]